MKKWLALLLTTLLLVPAYAEDWEEEWLFVDLSGEELVAINATAWDFPVTVLPL